MKAHTRLWPQFATGLILAVALAIAWGTLMVWGGYFWTALLGSNQQVYESFGVLADGTPVIQTASMGNRQFLDRTLRTLDNRPITLSRDAWLNGPYFAEPLQPPALFDGPIRWASRIGALSSYERPPVGWYLIRDDEMPGHAYFVGYDEMSKLNVGFIGRAGFRRTQPPREEWFDVGRKLLGWSSGIMTGATYIQYGQRATSNQPVFSGNFPQPWQVFLLDGNRLIEIDLHARSISTIFESPDLLAVAMIDEPIDSASKDVQQPVAQLGSAKSGSTTADYVRYSALKMRVAVKGTDRLWILDPPTSAKTEFILPELVRDKGIQAYKVGNDELLLQWSDGNRGRIELGWLKPDGTFSRRETVTLAGPSAPSERSASWVAAAVAPVPIGWLIVLTVFGPLGLLQANRASSIAEALAEVFGVAWPALLAVIAVGALLAWWTYRLQQKHRRGATGFWCAFVLLLGVPGFLAYWLEQRRTKREACKQCGAVVPRDREACAACNVEFSAPPLLGTEIFA